MHDMNPFHFVPLPSDGPRIIPSEIYDEPRMEGYISYSLSPLTPLHITGKTSKSGQHFDKKYFYENYGRKVIPGASVRGMISAFIETLTGSDLRVYTRGDEVGASGIPAYGKHYKRRHVGFLMTSEDDIRKDVLKAKGEKLPNRNRCRFERHETLPRKFGHARKEDMARFMFGYVDQEEGKDNEEVKNAQSGKLVFEDILLPEDLSLIPCDAWDLNKDAIMGGPKPRANTAWYFTPGESRVRKTYVRINQIEQEKLVWEVLADKVRGRKFYFHQDHEQCHKEYRKWKEWMEQLVEYKVEAVPPASEISGGRIYFRDLPESMLMLLIYALNLEGNLAHKLGALKPFGFGSVRTSITDLYYRNMTNPLAPIKSQGLKGRVNSQLFDMKAYGFLKKIMHFPEANEKAQYLFLYPPFNPKRKKPYPPYQEYSPEEKGFAFVLKATGRESDVGNVNRNDCTVQESKPSPSGYPTPENSKKITMFFDHYQKTAKNYKAVMGGLEE